MHDPGTRQEGPRAHVSTAVVIPAGSRDDVADTLDSVRCFVPPPRHVVLINDSGSPDVARLAELDPDVEVILPPPGLPSGTTGGLWRKVAGAYKVVLDRGPFDVVIRMDADALLIGSGLEAEAARRFAEHPGTGILGACRLGPDGARRDWAPAARCLRAEIGVRGVRKPRLRRVLRERLAEATEHGYEPGAHALGTSVLSARLLEAWSSRGWLDLPELVHSGLDDDMIAGLLSYAAGFDIGDMSGPSDSMAVAWRGLSAPPAALLAARKTLVHSVRFYRELSEDEIRAEFRRARRGLSESATSAT